MTARTAKKATKTAKPPKPAPSPPLGDKLVAILSAQRELGGASYPPTLARLAELAGASLALVKKALGAAPAKETLLSSLAGAAASKEPARTLTLFAEDAADVGGSDRLLQLQLARATAKGELAVAGKALATGLAPELKPAFEAALARRLTTRVMPAGIGALPAKKAPLFFAVASAILPSAAGAPPAPAARAPTDFAARFDDAFRALDLAAGGSNYVTLASLRAALPDVDRALFDEGLHELRRSRRYSLDPSDGRHHQPSDAERAAGIVERGTVLVYVAKREDA